MRVVMIVRTAPDAAGAQRPQAKQLHQKFGRGRFGQNGVMLLVMIDHKHPDAHQPGQQAAKDPERYWPWDESPGGGGREQRTGGKNAPPAGQGIIPGVGFGAKMQTLRNFHDC